MKFPWKDFIDQYISDFYRPSENSKRPDIQKYEKMAPKGSRLSQTGLITLFWKRFILIIYTIYTLNINTLVSTDG